MAALVSSSSSGGIRSTLNPNAPLFIPSYVRQVEDFSQEWWDLVTTSTWFRDYWLSQHQGQGEEEEDDIQYLLPDNIDVDVDEDILSMEAQYEEFLGLSEDRTTTCGGKMQQQNALQLLIKTERVLKLPKEAVMKKQHWDNIKMNVSPRFIQQPR